MRAFSKAESRRNELINDYPQILDDNDKDFERKANALISFYFHIPYPEDLPDELWMEKYRQIEWLARKGMLGLKV